MMIRSAMGLVLMRIVAQFGTLVIAAYTVGMRLRMVGFMPNFGFGGAAATMVGQNLGAGDPERSRRSAWWATGMAVGVAAASIGIVRGRAMNGAGDTVSPLVITLVALWGFQIPAAIYLSGISKVWGVAIPFRGLFSWIATGSETGIWYAMVASSALQAIICAAWFSTGRWKHKNV